MNPADASPDTPGTGVTPPSRATHSAGSERCIVKTDRPIDLSRVDAEFSVLWHQAAQQLGKGQEAHIVRACLWNLVVVQPPSPGAAASGDTGDRIDLDAILEEVTLSVPSRIISLHTRANPSGEDLEAHLSVRCVRGPSGGGTVVSEEVALSAPVEGGVEHFPALVRALLVPDLPVALVWLGGLPRKGRLLSQLAHQSDRILVDSRNSGPPAALVELHDVVRSARVLVSDLAWSRLTPVRYLLAGLFDPPGHAENLMRLERLELETTGNGRNQGLLLLGWLLARSANTTLRAVESAMRPAPPLEQYRWQVTRGDRRVFPVNLATRAEPVAGTYDGILKVEIHAAGQRYAMERMDADHVMLKSPHTTDHQVAIHGWAEADLVVSALESPRGDPLYVEALKLAAEMMDQELWNE